MPTMPLLLHECPWELAVRRNASSDAKYPVPDALTWSRRRRLHELPGQCGAQILQFGRSIGNGYFPCFRSVVVSVFPLINGDYLRLKNKNLFFLLQSNQCVCVFFFASLKA